MTYPEKPLPPVSVELDHEREILKAVDVVTVREPGIVGAVASTDTDVVAVVVPFAFVAVKVKRVVVARAGVVVLVPVTVPIVGLMEREVALDAVQLRVLVPFNATSVGDAEKDEMEGRLLEIVVPDETVDDAEVFPTLSLEVV